MATTAALVGLTLATNPTQAFQALSARYRTADLAVTIDATKVTSAQLAATRRLPGVTKAVGYPATTVNVTIPATPGYREGVPVSGPLTVVGRASRSGPLDHITQKSGRWPARLGEIDDNDLSGTRGSVGLLQTITVTGLRGKPKLAIVGWGSLARRTIRRTPGPCPARSPPWKGPARPGRSRCFTPSATRPPSARAARTWPNCRPRRPPGRSTGTPLGRPP